MQNIVFALVLVVTAVLVPVSGAHAQIGVGPSLGGLGGPIGARPSLGGLFEPGTIGTLNLDSSLGNRPNETLSMPKLPTQQWVPPQQEFAPAIGREIYVPPHFADTTPDGRVIHPPMTVPNPNGGPPVFLPGGENPVPGIAP